MFFFYLPLKGRNLSSSRVGRAVHAVEEVLGQQHPSGQVTVEHIGSKGVDLVEGLRGKLGDEADEGRLLRGIHLSLVDLVPDLLEVIDDALGRGGPVIGEAAAESVGRGRAAEGNLLGVGGNGGEVDAVEPDGVRVAKGNVRGDLGG